MKLKAISWNIWGGKYINEIISFLREADADIIALQEVIKDDAEGNTALTITRALGYEEPVYDLGMKASSKWMGPASEKEETIDFGNAILSKYKIIKSNVHQLTRRTAIQADIQIVNSILHIFSIHLRHCHVQNATPESELLQKEQINALLKILPPEKTLVMGDFNGVPESYAVKQISSALEDAEKNIATPTWSIYPEGCETCSPSGVQYKFDYIFASKDLKPRAFEVKSSKASDHLPVSAIIEI